ncbi:MULTISPECIES: hypothetical protein [unclassified Novosphingobium]|uniref:hypothetical protein n=1 Tax=unclassified Novosphingobium TaxID=2644732 RepID=UPI000D4CFC16|nr:MULTISPECIES: hypothetical protein [unclassified Novosphingobium]PTR06404.1 hypothetical protein C8K11_12017 [Novosphingobium sp. GV055]PUA94823.1 hypothetical protein C8K12_12017 [Novosphingobium sp. GV061]PUB13748.1 hypothetical protein C8K14_12017 [Novosphingobium sp. GV079]PUB38446.1 hypothetical protein C8K10_12017 [Novosphingobium sp. GV027]
MKGHIAAGLALALAGCGGEAAAPAPGGSTSAAATTEAAAETSAAPEPNFVERRNGIYYYLSQVSENDQKDGRGVGHAVGFRYLGKAADGDFKVAGVTDGGATVMTATCSDPCKIIHVSTGEAVGYEPTTVIGGVFTDAMNGLLEVAPAKHGTTSK